jgi:hypothetical protein
MRLLNCLFLIFAPLLAVHVSFSQNGGNSAADQLIDRIMSVHDEVMNNPKLQVRNFLGLDSTSLPVGIVKEIGNTIYTICIDSARFTPEGAFFSAYMAMDFPGANGKIAFAAKNIRFNPQGVIVSGGAKLQLVSKNTIKIGPKFEMVFKDDGKNFVEWDCNGYKQAGLSIDFIFSTNLIKNAADTSQPVKASMEVVVADLNNIVFSLPSITPFYVKGAEDFIFSLQDITIDRSEYSTPSGVSLSPQNLAAYNNDRAAWKGFYAGNASVTLPAKLSKNEQPMEIYASNLLIDDAGFSGSFGVDNLFTDGKMAGWGFSVTKLEVGFTCNELTSGLVKGAVTVSPLDNKSFNYSANMSRNPNTDKLDYTFVLSIGNEPITIQAFKSTLTLESSSKLVVQSVNNKFVPTATLTGSWTVDFTKAKITGVRFQDLTITTQAPYITNGYFSLVANQSESNCTKFPVSLNNVGMSFSQNQLAFGAEIGLVIGGDNVSFGVNTAVKVYTKLEEDAGGKLRLKYDRFAISDISFACSTSVFTIQGVISVRNDDPVFGDLFYGSISLKIENLLKSPLMVSAGFGKFPDYKYWFTDVSVPIRIPVMTGVYITSIYGGVQNRVATTLSTQQRLDRVAGNISIAPGMAIPFVPDPNMGLTFTAGVGISAEVEKVFNGDVLLSVSFNSSGGFQSILFAGQAFMMVKRSERQKSNATKVQGTVTVSYDNAQKVFDAQIGAIFVVPNILDGNLSIKIHIDENNWYFWLNRPSQRATVNLIDLFHVQTYFMIGTQIEAIPPPPSYVTNIVGSGHINQLDLNALGNGSGFCTGLEIGVHFGGEFPKNTKWRGYVGLDVGAGFDVMVFNSENSRCSGSSDPIGVNGYYAMGQVYAYLSGGLGARKYKDGELKKQYDVGSMAVAGLLQGKLPKPSYVYGAVGVKCTVLFVITFHFDVDVEFGNDCNIVSM